MGGEVRGTALRKVVLCASAHQLILCQALHLVKVKDIKDDGHLVLHHALSHDRQGG